MKWLLAAIAALVVGLMTILVRFSGALAGAIVAQGQRCTFKLPALPSQAANASSPPGLSTTQEQAAGTAEQRQNLMTIIGQVKGIGLPARTAIIAVATGLSQHGACRTHGASQNRCFADVAGGRPRARGRRHQGGGRMPPYMGVHRDVAGLTEHGLCEAHNRERALQRRLGRSTDHLLVQRSGGDRLVLRIPTK